MNEKVIHKRSQRKYHVPVIGHFADKSVRFNSIVDAERITGINYNLILKPALGKYTGPETLYGNLRKGITTLNTKPIIYGHWKKSANWKAKKYIKTISHSRNKNCQIPERNLTVFFIPRHFYLSVIPFQLSVRNGEAGRPSLLYRLASSGLSAQA